MTVRVRVKMFTEEVRAAILSAAGKRAEKAANMLAKAIRKNISTPGPGHSQPGEYPRKQSGELVAGVKVVQRNQYRFDVVSTAEHADIVEEMRPYMERTTNEVLGALEREVHRP